jgi:hypothetical protein
LSNFSIDITGCNCIVRCSDLGAQGYRYDLEPCVDHRSSTDEDAAERRRYALLQASATIYAAMPHPAEASKGPMVAFSVSAAEELLKRIERREKADEA